MPILTPTRRGFMAGASALAASALARPTWAAAPALTVASRQIEVLGRAATVYGMTGPDGRPGIYAQEGDRFSGQILNTTDQGLITHWHGQIWAAEGQDRSYTGGGELAPGAGDAVDFLLTPGTHWMHSHQLTEQQLLAAPMITREADAEDIQEVVLMLHDFAFRSPEEILSELGVSMMHGHGATGNESGSMPGKAMDHSAMNMGGMDMGGMAMGGMMTHANDVKFDAYLANDRTLDDPEVVQVDPGARVRLRIINGAGATAFWIDPGVLPSACIATDGGACAPLSAAAYPIAQGQRLDLIVTVPAEGGAFPIFAQVEAMRLRTGIILATAGAKVAAQSGEAATESPYLDSQFDARLVPLHPLPERAAKRSAHLMLGEEPGYRFTINGQTHGEAPPIAAQVGDRVELMFMNMGMMMHPMHLHGYHFQVVDLGNGRFNGPRRDVVAVPPGGMVTVAVDIDKPGSWFLHCHHLYHMASGMMTEVLVS
jgi:FtsP/CotA-like multicopper oxidase with cupredoxin domain